MDKETIKVKIIEFSLFNGIRMMHATHYYVNGRRVSQNDYYHYDSWLHKEYEHEGTRQWHDKNKNGVDRDYTEITYKRRDKPRGYPW